MNFKLGFIKSYGKTKAEGIVDSALDALVRFDPKGASEAELDQMDAELDHLGRDILDARRTLATESRELAEAKDLESRRMTAAEKLGADLERESDPAKRGQVEASLATLMDLVEKGHANVEAHGKSEAEARAWVDELQAAYDGAAAKLKGARAGLEAARRDLQRSELEKRQAAEREERSRQIAGLASARSSIGVALGAMQDAARSNRDDAELSRMKSDALRPTRPEVDDPLIAAAMGAAQPKAGPSAAERLAAMRGRLAA